METKPIRFGALDVFSGMTIVFMIIVNSPAKLGPSICPFTAR
jgi:predicted acyltransferase